MGSPYIDSRFWKPAYTQYIVKIMEISIGASFLANPLHSPRVQVTRLSSGPRTGNPRQDGRCEVRSYSIPSILWRSLFGVPNTPIWECYTLILLLVPGFFLQQVLHVSRVYSKLGIESFSQELIRRAVGEAAPGL